MDICGKCGAKKVLLLTSYVCDCPAPGQSIQVGQKLTTDEQICQALRAGHTVRISDMTQYYYRFQGTAVERWVPLLIAGMVHSWSWLQIAAEPEDVSNWFVSLSGFPRVTVLEIGYQPQKVFKRHTTLKAEIEIEEALAGGCIVCGAPLPKVAPFTNFGGVRDYRLSKSGRLEQRRVFYPGRRGTWEACLPPGLGGSKWDLVNYMWYIARVP